ncbi:Checkpoint serine/threonine-protein kinase bub1 like [Verticillium longisporum]|nr:Checkpoint serine/threonine-protein kinase bub1 like [Verticillium longisporum]
MDTLPEDDVENLGHMVKEKLTVYTETVTLDENGNIQKKGKSKKMKTMEFNETQIIKANLDSPSKPTKLKKRNATAEPTMTLHTKAATDDIYEIFSQPLKPTQPLEDEEEDEDESDEDDYETDGDGDYTSGAESTITTTRQVDTSEAGEDDDDEPSDVKSVSEWSDFSTRRHVPDLNEDDEVEESNDTQVSNLIDINEDENSLPSSREPTGPREEDEQEPDDFYEEDDDVDDDLQTPIEEDYPPRTQTVFVPIPPEDYEPRTRPYRDPVEAANNRLPFMTPITERTESSLGVLTARRPQMSPTKKDDNEESDDDDGARADQLFSSPLREIYNDAQPTRVPQPILEKPKPKPLGVKTIPPKGPVITDPQCNPVDDVVRKEILAKMHPPLSSYAGFFDHQAEKHGKGSEIRKAAKLMAKARSSGERTSNAFSVVEVEFPDTPTTYTIRKELGAGAFAPVYLVENSTADQEVEDQENNGAAVMGKGAFAESLKRYWQTEIWGECFDLLLNPGSFVEVEEGQKMPILRGLKQVRERMEAWLEENCERGVGLKSLVGKVEAHARARR